MEDSESDDDPNVAPLDVPNFPNAFFHLELKRTKSFKHKEKDIVNEHSYTAKLRDHAVSQPNATLGDIHNQVFHLFHSLIAEISETYQPGDLIRVFITHEEMVNTNIVVGPDYLGNISPQLIMDQIADVIRSNNFIPADKNLSINVAAIRNIQGLNFRHVINMAKDLTRKGCIISINNHDNLCLPRSIAVALALEETKRNPDDKAAKRRYNTMRQSDRNQGKNYSSMSLQKCTALRYQKAANIPQGKIGLITDIPAYEDALKVGINVISARSGNKKVFNGNQKYPVQIFLYHVHCVGELGHFSVLTRVNALLCRSYYCNDCDTGFNNNDRHRCRQWCDICGRKGCLGNGVPVQCKSCHAFCRSEDCLQHHQTPNSKTRKSKCNMMLFCPKCKVSLRKNMMFRDLDMHTCGETFCRNCRIYHLGKHRCYMRSTPAKPTGSGVDEKRFIFYDFESMQTSSGDHEPNLVVAQSICEACKDVTEVLPSSKCARCGDRCDSCSKTNRDGTDFAMENPCAKCGFRETIFSGNSTVTDFCSWLFSPKHKNFTVLAHNARAYDTYFLYQYMLENSIVPHIIFRGSKIIYCHVAKGLNIRLLDSLNFLPMPLSQLPKSFGLTELKKGYFPHLFNHEENVRGKSEVLLPRLPDVSFYDVDSMKSDRRHEFLKWYSENCHKSFDLFPELLEYCRSDVNILLSACWKFRSLVMDCTGPEHPVDPFDYTTIASLCMGIYRSKFLTEEWNILFKHDADVQCRHEWNCPCPRMKARKTYWRCSLRNEK